MRWWPGVRFAGGEAGDAGVATGVVLLAVVVSGAVVATNTLDLSNEGAQAYEQAAHEAIAGVSNSLYVRGGVVAEDTDRNGSVDVVSVPLALAPGGESIVLGGEDGSSLLVVRYTDATAYEPAGHSLRWLSGEVPGLDDGELVEVLVSTPSGGGIEAGEEFRLEIVAPVGGTLVVERQAPSTLAPVAYLH